MLPLAAAIAIPAGAAALNGLSNYLTSRSNEKLSKEMQERDFEWQESMYNKYYSPVAQVQQLRDAGLNPALGDASSFSGSSMPSTPSHQPIPKVAPQVDASSIVNSVAASQQMNLQESQEILANMESARKVVETGSELAKTFGYKAGKDYIERALSGVNLDGQSNYQRMFEQQYNAAYLANERTKLETSLRQQFGAQSAEKSLALIDKQMSEINGRISLMITQGKLNEKSAFALGAQMAKDFAQASNLSAQSSQILQLLPYYQKKLQNEIQSLANQNVITDIAGKESKFSWDKNYWVRRYIMSNEGQHHNLWSFKQTPEGNYVNATLNGLSSSIFGGFASFFK